MALLVQYHSRYHAKVIDPCSGNNRHCVSIPPNRDQIPAVVPYLHGIANALLPARLEQPGLHNSRGGSAFTGP
jgi:hypothetical protein